MGVDHRNVRYCDICGSTVAKMHRIFNGEGYCATCYKRLFKCTECTACGKNARIHVGAAGPALCGACRRIERTCVRCASPVPRAGCTVPGGVVCPSCSVHFRSEGACDGCGKVTQRLSSNDSVDAGRLCESCRNRATHATCVHCRRYRARAGRLESGAWYCRVCGPDGNTTHQCPGCGGIQPGIGRGRCRACLNYARLLAEARLSAFGLSRDWAREALEQFAKWLLQRQPSAPRLLGVFRHHIPFFERVDAAFVDSAALNASELLDLFQVSGLRSHLLPTAFLEERFQLVVDDALKASHAERQRILELQRKCKRFEWCSDLNRYVDVLAENDSPVRTQRLYVSAAVSFMLGSGVDRVQQLSDLHLRAHLARTPGSRNSLGRYLKFLQLRGLSELRLPPRSGLPDALPRDAKQLRSLLKRIERLGMEAPAPLLERALSIAFGLRTSVLRSSWTVEVADGRPTLRSGAETLIVPDLLADIARRWGRHQAQDRRA
jgi:hypothetical protein